MAKTAEEVLQDARERLEEMKAAQGAQTSPTPVLPPEAQTPALSGNAPVPGDTPPPTAEPATTGAPALQAQAEPEGQPRDADAALAAARSRLSKQQQDAGVTPEDEKSWFTDVKTTAKIAALYPIAGKLGRGETEMGLRELTKGLVWDQLNEEQQAAILAVSDKGIDEMKWNDLQSAGRKALGETTYNARRSRSDETIVERKGNEWDRLTREMMGYRQGDWNDASGTAFFPMAKELIGGSIQSGTLSFYEHFIRPVFSDDTPELAENMVESIREATENYRVETKGSLEKTMVAEDAVWYNPFTYFDETTKDPYHDFSAFSHTLFQQSGNLAGMAIAARLGGRAGASYSTRKFGRPGDTVERIQSLQRTGARVGGAGGGGKAEMSMIRDGVFMEVNQRIQNDLPEEVWENHGKYQELIAGGLTEQEAKQVIAYSHANNAGDTAMVISGALMGTPMGAFYGQMTGISAGRQLAKESILKQMGKGALYETGQEMSQEFSEAIIGNLGVMKVNPEQDLWEGGLEAVVTAFFISGPTGALGGIHSDKGAGIAAERDRMIREQQQWMNASNERWKHQNKVGPNSTWAKDAAPQDQLQAMLELERLQKKEAEEFMKIRAPLRALLEESGADTDKLVAFDAKAAGYESDLAMIAKQQKRRILSKKQAREAKAEQRERQEARRQVERDVTTINENMSLVEDMLAIQRGEGLAQEGYDRLAEMGYGTYTGKADSNFVLTKRGTRAMQELSAQAGDLRKKIDSGYRGGERREDAALRESMENLTDEEFEAKVMKDPTTNLWNKRRFDQDIPNAKAVAVIDADSLGWVNDNMSHSAGNQYLRTITRELENLGKGMEAYRYGGDEFVVMGQDEEQVQQAVEAALNRINNAPRVQEGGQSVRVSLSAGYGSDFDSADASMNAEKRRREEAGERMDKRDPKALPPSFKTVSDAKSPQLTLFSMGDNRDLFNDDAFNDTNKYYEDEWSQYIKAADYYGARKFQGITQVDEQHFQWIEEVVDEFLPRSNSNSPPVSIVHDAQWLRTIDKDRYDEIMDLPFGATGVRGIFSMDAPTHGVYLLADSIVAEAEKDLKLGNRISTWRSARHRIKEGDQVELIDNETGEVEHGIVEFIDTAVYEAPRETQAEKRSAATATKARLKLNKLQRKETALMKQVRRMKPAKRSDRNHPLHKQLSAVLDDMGVTMLEMQRAQADLNRARTERWSGRSSFTVDTKEDEIHIRRGDELLIFDPNENAILEVVREDDAKAGNADVTMGQFRGKAKYGKAKGWSSVWHTNLGNVVAAEDEELTKEMLQAVAADTLMHETVGHFGIRGITRDWDNYIKLTHAITDAFPEVVEGLRLRGYTYREDIERGEFLNDQNKALLGEEVLAHVVGDLFGNPEMAGMTLPQKSAISRFLTWFKTQLLKLGYNRIYRRRKAAEIRRARNRLHSAKTDQEKQKAWNALYGKEGLVSITLSGVRTGGHKKGKKQPTGVVARSSKGFLNDDDLLNIIARSNDFIRNGKKSWQFVGHDGKPHVLPMRDVEIFRKPVWYVMAEGTRKRTEEERLSEEEKAYEPKPIPTMEEAYQKVTGQMMPEGWKPLTPADFKDESKRLEREMSEGKTDDEIKQMRKDRVFPNPKQLFDEATAEMSSEQRAVAGQVQSFISAAKKEKEHAEKGIKSKQQKIERLEIMWGRQAVENDQIPIFPEIGTIDDYFDALRGALPSSKGPGYISPMEVEASGFYEKVWPSRMKYMLESNLLSGDDLTSYRDDTGITGGRMAELAQPHAQMTKEEAQKTVDWMTKKNAESLANNNGEVFPRSWLDPKLIQMNNALSLSALTEVMGQYGLSQQSPTLATLHIMLGENNSVTKEFEQALIDMHSADPDKITAALAKQQEIMNMPLDTSKLQVTKEWVMSRIETPSYEVSVAAPQASRESQWKTHYERITGGTPTDQWNDPSDITDQNVRRQVVAEVKKDVEMGADVGYDEQLGRWITPLGDYETSRYLHQLMPVWADRANYRGFVFWQSPRGTIDEGDYDPDDTHFHHAHYRGRRDRDAIDAQIFGHARVTSAKDADPNAPTAPNPAMQGKIFVNFENQGDHAQDASKRYGSKEEAIAAKLQRGLNGMALQQNFHHTTNGVMEMMIDLFADEMDGYTASDEVEHWMVQRYGQEKVTAFSPEERRLAKELVALNRMQASNWASVRVIEDALSAMRIDAKAAQEPLERAGEGYQGTRNRDIQRGDEDERTLDNTFIGDARLFEWLDQRALWLVLRHWAKMPGAISDMAHDYMGISPNMQEWQTLIDNGGFVNMVKSGLSMGLAVNAPGRRIKKVVNHAVNFVGKASQNNMAGHRQPVMEKLTRASLIRLGKVITLEPDDQLEQRVDNLLAESKRQGLLKMRIPYKEMADIGSVDYSEMYNYIDLWAAESSNFNAPKMTTESDNEIIVQVVAHADHLASLEKTLTQSLKDFLAVKMGEGSVQAMEQSIRQKREALGKDYTYNRTSIGDWVSDLDIQMASVRITDDTDNPFALKNEALANGLSVEESMAMMANHDIENFNDYIQRRWRYTWSRADEETQQRLTDEGGDENTPDPNMMESYLAQYNDEEPAIYMFRIPTGWEADEKTVTEVKPAYVRRQKVGGDWEVLLEGEVVDTVDDRYDLEQWFSEYVLKKLYNSRQLGQEPPATVFASTNERFERLRKEADELEARVAAELTEASSKVEDMFSDDSMLPKYTIGEFSDLGKTFLEIIDSEKKEGWSTQQLIEKNEQWRVTEMLWSISEAVRNGYSRVGLIAGAASGRRGGFIDSTSMAFGYWHHANSINYTLEQRSVRGEIRDVLIVQPDNIKEPMWIDVTEASMRPFHEEKYKDSRSDDPLDGYLPASVIVQLGRDVAENIAYKIKGGQRPTVGRLLISKQETQGLFESWLIHDTNGNVLAAETSKERAEERREQINTEAAPKQDVISGTVTTSEIGGPIQFLLTKYLWSGYQPFALTDDTQYQHSVSTPTLYGGRQNYDIALLSRYRGHLKQFGVEIEEGAVKVPTSSVEEAVIAEGARRTLILPEALANQHPNIRVEEVTGENYGWIINSDGGLVIPNIFALEEDAMSAYQQWVDDNTVGPEGTIKIWTITINDKLRDYHSRPVNPFLNVNYQLRGNEKLQSALKKIGSNKPSLKERYLAWKQSWKASFNTGVFDRFYGILYAMKKTGQGNLAAEDNPYMQARMGTGLDSVMRGIMEYGHPVRREGVIENEGKGLLKILEPVGDQIELWAGYMAGVRAERLLAEGREQLFEPDEIKELIALGEEFPIFKEVAADYARWNKKLLDFAEDSGVINADTRPLWENADYIPFYRIVDARLTGPLAKGVGIANQQSPIATLRGGKSNLGDLVHNIFINATRIMDSSMKNHAAVMAIDILEPTGIIRKQSHDMGRALVPMGEIEKILKANGISHSHLDEEVKKGLQVMFAVQPPKGDGVISILRNGKKEYYYTEDELLYRSLTALNMKAFGQWMSLLRAPKRLLTTLVTLDPGFMAANFIRDSMSAFVLSRDTFIPMYGGLKGFAEAITEGDTMKTMISSGAAFENGFINQGDPESTHRYIKRAMRDAGFQRTLLNTPRKLFEAWKRLGSATENANRIAVYEAAIRAGKSKAQALYESKDLMDFSMGGDWPFIQFLIQTVPFMGARMQGLQRLGRGAAEHPVAFTLKGSLLMMAGMALWFAFRDDERYKELEDWEKDTYFHWWIGDTHYRLPKGFEVGAIFNTIPERIFEAIYSEENDAGQYLLRRFGFMIAETFNMNPVPQAVRPLVESMANYNFFTGRSIESPWEQQKLPPDRYKYYTSPTMIELADALPEGLNTVANGKIRSPLHLQNIFAGYTGTLGRYALMAADEALRQTGDYPIPPERQIADYPVIGRFYRGEGPRRTRYEEEFYRELRTTQQIMGSYNAADEAGDDQRIRQLEERYAPYIDRAQDFQNLSREITDLNREVRETYQDDTMSKKEKRSEIDQIQREKNAIFKEAFDDRPSAADDDETDLNTLMDNFDPATRDGNTLLKEQAPQTAALFDGVVGMNKGQLDRLSRADNYTRRDT